MGERLENIEETRFFVDCNIGNVLRESAIYESPGWQMENVPAFLNQVLEVETELSWKDLLTEIKELEEFYGKPKRTDKYLSREMDVDILLIDDLVIEEPDLIVPHPRMNQRKFVLFPLSELAADKVHPIEKKTIADLLKECEDPSEITRVV